MLLAETLPLLHSGRVTVGLSGGRDSVALLRALLTEGCELTACHVNHGIRGAAADADEQFCRDLCRDLGVPLQAVRVDVPALAAQQHLSEETAARRARRQALMQAAERCGSRVIALAHHADDQAETALFRMARGAAGARGMLPVRRDHGFCWVRPLLGTRRAELTAYLEGLGQRWTEDATNAGDAAVRNRLRHEILPALSRAMGRDVTPILCRSAQVQGEVQQALEEALAQLPLTDPQGRLYLPALAGASAAFTHAVLRRYLARAGVPHLTAELVARVAAVLPPDAAAARVSLPGDMQARRSGQRLTLLTPSGEPIAVAWSK